MACVTDVPDRSVKAGSARIRRYRMPRSRCGRSSPALTSPPVWEIHVLRVAGVPLVLHAGHAARVLGAAPDAGATGSSPSPACSSTPGAPGPTRSCCSRRSPSTTPPGCCIDSERVRRPAQAPARRPVHAPCSGTSAILGDLEVRRLRVTADRRAVLGARPRRTRRSSRWPCRSASRSSPSTTSPTWWTSTGTAGARRRARSSSSPTSRCSRSSWPGRSCATTRSPSSWPTPSATGSTTSRAGFPRFALGLTQEGRHRRHDRADRRRRVRDVRRRHDDGDRLGRRAGLHGAALLRLLRLLGHGDRPRADDRLPAAGELRPAVLGGVDHRLLAALAHVAVALVPRLRLHPARRQPARGGEDLPQPDHHLRR